jgi:hypothetical protein
MKYSIWIDNEEQWDPDVAESPVATVEASSAYAAAEKFATEDFYDHGDELTLIVRSDGEGGYYTQINLKCEWKVHRSHFTSLEELCAP